jgi:DNA polymerase-4
LADHPGEKEISLLSIGVSHLEDDAVLQLELPFELDHEERRPGTRKGAARWVLDRSVDEVREKFGRDSVGYGSVELGERRSIPDEFRELAERPV